MNNLDKQYKDLLQDIIDNGVTKSDRTGTGTLSVFGRQIRHKMSEGFPLLTTKKMAWKTMVTELLWFLRGDSDIRFLWENNCTIWDGDWYKKYKTTCSEPYTLEEVKHKVKDGNHSFHNSMFDMGPIYGKQWRSWRGQDGMIGEKDENGTRIITWNQIDQIANLINDLKTNPDSRRLMVTAWNPAELDQMVLPPCHYGFQVYTRELSEKERYNLLKKYKGLLCYDGIGNVMEYYDSINIPKRAISLMWNQRSVDTFLGLPFNIASYGLLLEIIAKEVNMVPDELIGNLGDTHLYLNHIEQAKEQIGRELSLEERIELSSKDPVFDPGDFGIGDQVTDEHCHEVCDSYSIPRKTREPFELPTLVINDEFWNPDTNLLSNLPHIQVSDFYVINYQSHPSIKAPLSN
jgi:thymidylate synthase